MGTLSRLERKNNRPCSTCGYSFSKDKTQCPSCRKMNIDIAPDPSKDNTVLLTDTKELQVQRISTGPWDENWGKHKTKEGRWSQGVVNTSVTLLGGAPGAGKSTLALQVASCLAEKTKREVLYIAGEESEAEIRSRAYRLNISLATQGLIRIVPMGVEIDLSSILENRKPAAVMVDSLPTVMPDPADAVEFASKLKSYAVLQTMPVILIDHVTKEEEFAGLMGLQHAVDTTLLFTVYDDGVRELKTVKNRNGPSGVVTSLDMTEEGLILREEDEDDEDDE